MVRDDSRYQGAKLKVWVPTQESWQLHIVRRNPATKDFEVLTKHQIVERTFAWFGRHRRISKDYEGRVDSSEAWIYIAPSHRMPKQLTAA